MFKIYDLIKINYPANTSLKLSKRFYLLSPLPPLGRSFPESFSCLISFPSLLSALCSDLTLLADFEKGVQPRRFIQCHL